MTTGFRGDAALGSARRRLGWPGRFPRSFWLATLLIGGIALALRLVNLAHPPGVMFDEVYYANEAQDLLQHGVEWVPESGQAEYVVHPPLGKWMIAVGEQLFGYNSFGWRIMAVLVGVAAIVLLMAAAWRLFRSTLLAAAAGLLVALDGMHFVLSRMALLDIFLMFWVVLAFYLLVLDREQRRARWLAVVESGGDTLRPRLGIPWYRIGWAVAIGLACGVKWSGLWYLLLFVAAAAVFDMGACRSAGVRHWFAASLVPVIGWGFAILGIALFAYINVWWGWFLSDDGYFRHWYAATHNLPHDRFIDPLVNLIHYHDTAYAFHTTLDKPHRYQSWPWQWLLLGRPVAIYWDPGVSCSADRCTAEVLLLGTPVLWWSFLPALAALTWLAIARRDGRAWLVLAAALAGIVPWFQSMPEHRTMFYFYALPAEPFLVLAVVYVLGALLGAPHARRRFAGSMIFGGYVLAVALCFAYFYPIYSATAIPYTAWLDRLWLGNRWA
ncbi:phospholipid carrier-dependent glycosyltransferase [Dactylosporangium vinaceum]|uniref:Polyprenol-phosphate-mannose--protein mannosyltransferase n=1 Tax=Dactylosporangium vinaceum TaxID=53362 RepID=A0ABV5M1H2_9ACTN|nr:glycosyltransferase family 39 protein [Dactylosporangium vinaceum]